jgi:prevent-host-death family protein
MEVSVRDLKSHLSEYLEMAQAGEEVIITSRQRPIASLRGVPPSAPEGLRRLIAAGLVSWNGEKPKGASCRLTDGGPAMSDMVIEDRG